jgi:ribosomal RNA assembly protein
MLRLPLSRQAISNIIGKEGKKKKQLEKLLNINIKIEDDFIVVATKDKAGIEYDLSQIFDALILGFEPRTAVLLLDPFYVFIKINVKALVRQSRLKQIMARIIGTGGKTIKKIEETADCHVTVHDHHVGLIGKAENVKIATEALNMLIQGKPFASVYRRLEQARKRLHYSKFQEEF